MPSNPLHRTQTAATRTTVYFAIAVMALTCGIRDAANSQERVLRSANESSADDVDQARQNISRQLFFPERDRRRFFDLALRDLKAGKTVSGLKILQQLLDQPTDRFIFRAHGTAVIGQRRKILDVYAGLNDVEWKTYDRLFDSEARRLFREAEDKGSMSRYRDVLQRYLFCSSAFDAGHQLALEAFDVGDYARALDGWERLWSVPAHRKRFTPQMKLLMAVACRKTGRHEAAASLMRQVGSAQFRIGGRLMTAREYFDRHAAGLARKPSGDWRLPLGSPSGQRSVAASPPYLQPVWSTSTATSEQSLIQGDIEIWRQRKMAHGGSTAVVNTPIVVGTQVITREFHRIVGRELKSGRMLWSYRAHTPFTTGTSRRSPFGSRTGAFSGPDSFATNEVLGSLTCDGKHLYFIDSMDWSPPDTPLGRLGLRDSRVKTEKLKSWNQLVAVAISNTGAKSEPKASWTLGGDPEKSGKAKLAGHFFLGPPLPVAERLYVVSEFQRRIRMLCLHRRTGEVLWQQAIAVVDENVVEDGARFLHACTPTFADGLLICPTHTGFLTAVDAFTGSLAWAAFVGDDPIALGAPKLGNGGGGHEGAGYRNALIARDGRVFVLTPGSENLRCLDAFTGQLVWSVSRDGARFLAAVTEERVVIAGRRTLRALSVRDGKTAWSTETGTPSGRGFVAGGDYLLPVQSGRVLRVDLATGASRGFSLPGLVGENASSANDNHWAPGNLIPAGELIVSAEAGILRVFPQSAPQLSVAMKAVQSDPNSPARMLTAARLSLILGDERTADRLLAEAIGRLDRSKRTDSPVHHGAVLLLRESLFARLRENKRDAPQLLDRIGRLVTSDADRARYLMHKAELALQMRRADELIKTVDALTALSQSELFRSAGDSSHFVSLSAWVTRVVRQSKHVSPAMHRELQKLIAERKQAALASSRIEPLERYLRIMGGMDDAAELRNELAQKLIEQRQDQRAELILLANRNSSDLRVAAVAAARLCRLWVSHGLYEQAAELLAELEGRFADVTLSDGRTTGKAFAQTLRDNRLVATALAAIQGPQQAVRDVEIGETRWLQSDPKLSATYNSFRQIFRTPDNSPYDLLDVGDGYETKLKVINRQTGVAVGSIEIPARHSYPALKPYGHVGQYFSLGTFGKMHGVSLLELHHEKPFWTATPVGFENREDMLLVGPAGPTFAVFQAHEHLVVVDPGTGRLLWQRTDLPSGGGLQGDPYTGLFGDRHALVALNHRSGDDTEYTLFDTETGAVLRRGRLHVSDEYDRQVFGRLLQYVAIVDGKTRVRVWDPLSDRLLVDLQSDGVQHSARISQREVVVLLTSGDLLLVDVLNGAVRKLSQLAAEQFKDVTYIKMFRTGGKLFVNLQGPHEPRAFMDMRFSFYAGDAFLPTEHIRGDLIAFDLTSGRRLWRRKFPQRTMLILRHGHLPVLVFASRTRDRMRGTRASLLIEVVDAATGNTLGLRDNLYPDRLLNMAYEPHSRDIVIRAIGSVIRVKLHHRRIIGPGDRIKL